MNNITDKIKSSPSVWDELKSEKRPIVLYGMGDGAVKLLAIFEKLGIKCRGVFASDDFVRYQSFMGYTVKKLSDIEAELGEVTVVSAFATRLDEVIENFRSINSRHTLFIPDINVSGDHLELFDADFLQRNSERLQAVFSALDTYGREFFEALLMYKYTARLEWLDRLESLRAGATLPYRADSVRSFADFGAYTGDTILEARALYPRLERAAGYEPDPRTFKKLEANTADIGIHVTLFNALALECTGDITLRSGGAMNTIIADNVLMCDNLQKKKCTLVKALTGDSSLPFIPDIIKMDVEGCEARALEGCREVISRHRPLLRISVYHNHRDLFEIYEKIYGMNTSYRFTLSQKCKYIPAWDVELIAY